MASYGTLPTDGGGQRSRRGGTSSTLMRVAVVSLLAGCAMIAMMAVMQPASPKPVSLMSQPVGGSDPDPVQSAGPEPQEDDEEEFVDAPTSDDVEEYEAGAVSVLTYLGLAVSDIQDQTDLEESCGDMLMPCMATVGNCVETNILLVEASGRLEPSSEACQCFASGLTDHISLEGRDDLLSCSFTCLEAISNIFDGHIEKENGDAASSVACPRTFMNMARDVYGTANDDFPVEQEYDGDTIAPVDDEGVVRAALAIQEHVNLVRKLECPLKEQFTGTPTVLYDEKGTAKDARGQYRMELAMGEDSEEFTGRVVHLPSTDQIVDPSDASADPDNLVGRFRVMRMSPDPCADGNSASLAVTQLKVKKINSQQLSWKAGFKPVHEGKTKNDFGTGYIKLPEHIRKAKTIQKLNTADIELPAAYDARDKRSDDSECRAYDILDQGSCGSCYAFAAASAMSARICRKTDQKWNVVMSPQEMLDCNNGCDGGNPLSVYETISNDGGYSVENFCDPYQEVKHVCGGVCATGNSFYGLDGTAYLVSGERDIMQELLLHGPGVVGFDIYDDFYAYTDGVYAKSEGANKLGGHAVSLIGWGTEDGVDYWLVQNSWGKDMGDEGFWKIRRGTDECGIETNGLTVLTPEHPAECPSTTCLNGGTPQKDCSCRCNGGYSGSTCDTCGLTCLNQGVLAPDCSECWCPPGRFGDDCGGLAALSETAMCLTDTTTLTLTATYGGSSTAPTQKTVVGFYNPDDTSTMSYVKIAYLCGTTYDANNNGGLCPSSNQVSLPKPTVAGTYKVAILPWIPENEFGQAGYPATVQPHHIFSMFTVTDDCSDAAIAAAETENDLMVDFQGEIANKATEAAQEQAAMNTRLDVAEQTIADLIAAMAAEPASSVEIAGMNSADPYVWGTGSPINICFVLPESKNVNPKHLLLLVGDGSSGSYYPTGLVNQGPNTPAPAAAEACTETSVSAGIPAGTYTIGLSADSGSLATYTFTLGSAWLGITQYGTGVNQGYNYVQLAVQWQITSSRAGLYDAVIIKNSAGAIAAWIYTSCNCMGPVGKAPVAAGSHTFTLYKLAGHVPGGYTVTFHPNAGDVIAAVAQDWINWSQIGF